MVNEDRRRVLKQLGATTSLVGVAGCLDGDGTESDSGGNSTSINDSEERPSEDKNPEPESSEDGDQSQGQESQSMGLLDYIPASSELQDLIPTGGSEAIHTVEHGYPMLIAEEMDDDLVSHYNENQGFIVPKWAGFGLSDIEEKVSFDPAAGGASVYKIVESADTRNLNSVAQVGELAGMDLYEWEGYSGEGKPALLVSDDIIIASPNNTSDEDTRELFTRIDGAQEGSIPRYVDEDQIGQMWDGLEYNHIFSAFMSGENFDLEGDQLATGLRTEVGSKEYHLDIGKIYRDGSYEVQSSESRENDSFLRGGNWITR